MKSLLKIILGIIIVPTLVYGASVFTTKQGGTGTGTPPTLGQVLLGNADGTYSPVATSSLGIIGGGSGNWGTIYTVCGSGCQYTTDEVDDDVQINQAILAASAAGAGTVIIKGQSACYDIASTSIKIYANVNIIGEGDITCLKRNASSTITRVMEVNGSVPSSNFEIKNLKIHSNEVGSVPGHYGMVLGQSYSTSSNYLIQNVTIASSSAIGINAVYSEYFSLDQIRVYSALQEETADGIDVIYSNNFNISNIKLKTGDDGLVIAQSNKGVVNNVINEGTIAGGTFRIGGSDSTVPTHDITVTNLVSINNDTAVSISNVQTVNQQTYNISISNVTVYGGNYGLKMDVTGGFQDGVTLPYKNITLSGMNTYGTFKPVYVGPYYTVDGLIISNVNAASSTSYGIELQSGYNVQLNNINLQNGASSGVRITSPSGLGYLKNIKLNNVNVSSSTGRGIIVGDSATLWATSSTITIDNSDFSNNTGNGMELSSTQFYVRNTKINNNGDHGVIINPLDGGYQSYIENSTISNNVGYGIFSYVFSGENTVTSFNNKINNNTTGDINVRLKNVLTLNDQGFFGVGTSTPTTPFEFIFKDSVSGIPYIAQYSATAMASNEQVGVVYGKSSANSQGFNMLYQHQSDRLRRFLNIKPNEATVGTGITIVATGNVGVGTTSPTSSFYVHGTGTTTPFTVASSSFASLFQIGRDGNVGIGTTTAQSLLTVVSTSSLRDTIPETTNTYSLGTSLSRWLSGWFTSIDSINASTTNATTTNLTLRGLTSTFLAVDPNGRVIATTSPTGGSGITSLNGQTGSSQTFASSTSGTDFSITSASDIHTFTLPSASASARGLLTSTDWSTFNSKVSGTGSTGLLALWNSATNLVTSLFMDNGTVTGVGATSSLVKFNVQGSGTLNPLNIASSTGVSLFSIANTGRVMIGSGTPSSILTVNQSTTTFQAPLSGTSVHFIGQSDSPFRMSVDTYSGASTFGSQIQFRRALGTSDTPLAVTASSTLFTIASDGYGTTGFHASSITSISGMAEGPFTDTSAPSILRFFTTATGSVTSLERFLIGSNGRLSIGTTSVETVATSSPYLKLDFFARDLAGNTVLSTKIASTTEITLQPAFASRRISMWTSGGSATGYQFGLSQTSSSTGVDTVPTFTNGYTSQQRTLFSTVVTTLNQQVGIRSNLNFFRSATTSFGGFYAVADFGFTSWTAGNRFYTGFSTCTSGDCIASTSTIVNRQDIAGFLVDGMTGTLTFATNDNAGVISTSSIPGMPTFTADSRFRTYIYSPAGDPNIYWRIDNMISGLKIAEGVATTNLMRKNVNHAYINLCSNGANTAANACRLGMMRFYVESQ